MMKTQVVTLYLSGSLLLLSACAPFSALDSVSQSPTSPSTPSDTDLGTKSSKASKLDAPGTVLTQVTLPAGLSLLSVSASDPAFDGKFTVDSSGEVRITSSIQGVSGSSVDLNYVFEATDGSRVRGKVTLQLAEGTATPGFAWGWNDITLFANGQTTNSSSPVSMSGLPAPLKSISLADRHACGLTASGQLYCWGKGTDGRLGDGGTTDRSVPTAIGGSLRFREVSASSGSWLSDGSKHTCAIAVDGTAYCWGKGANGRLGNNAVTDLLSPTAVVTTLKFLAISSGGDFTCGLDFDSVAHCWGKGTAGRLGTGDETDRLIPTPVSTSVKFQMIAAGAEGVCAIALNGDLYCWGYRESASDPFKLVPTQRALGKKFIHVDGDASSFCVVDTNQDGSCFGHAMYGRLGIGNWDTVARAPLWGIDFYTFVYDFMPLATPTKFKSISVGKNNSCGIDTNSALWCWGRAEGGEVGNGVIVTDDTYGPYGYYAPVPINDTRTYHSVSVGDGTTIGL